MVGSGTSFGAHPAAAARTPQTSKACSRRITMKSLQQAEAGEQSAGHVGDDRHLAVARLVNDDAPVTIETPDAVAVPVVLRIEHGGHATDVELQPRRDRLDELIYPLPLERGDVHRG